MNICTTIIHSLFLSVSYTFIRCGMANESWIVCYALTLSLCSVSIAVQRSAALPYTMSYIHTFSEVEVMCNFLFSFSSFHRLILILWLFVPSTRIDYYCSPHTRRRTNTHNTHTCETSTHKQIASDSQNFMRSKSIESIKFAMYVFVLCLILSRARRRFDGSVATATTNSSCCCH